MLIRTLGTLFLRNYLDAIWFWYILIKSRTAETAIRPRNHLENIIEDLNLQRFFSHCRNPHYQRGTSSPFFEYTNSYKYILMSYALIYEYWYPKTEIEIINISLNFDINWVKQVPASGLQERKQFLSKSNILFFNDFNQLHCSIILSHVVFSTDNLIFNISVPQHLCI